MVQVGTPEELINSPANSFVQQFVGGKNDRWNEQFKIDAIMMPVAPAQTVKPLEYVTVSASLQEVLIKLTKQEQLQVLKDGTHVGYIDRKAVIQYIGEKLQERGTSNE